MSTCGATLGQTHMEESLMVELARLLPFPQDSSWGSAMYTSNREFPFHTHSASVSAFQWPHTVPRWPEKHTRGKWCCSFTNLLQFCFRLWRPGEEPHGIFNQPSVHPTSGQRDELAVYSGSNPGHHHRHELPGCAPRGHLCWAPAVLYLLLHWAVLAELHHAGELQL